MTTQAASTPQQFVMEFYDKDGATLATRFIFPDLDPLREDLRLQHRRRGLGSPDSGMQIEPRWGKSGPPFVAGLVATSAGGVCEVPRTYFDPLAQRISRELVEGNLLQPGDTYLYRVVAQPGNGSGSPAAADPFAAVGVVEEDAQSDCTPGDLDALHAQASPVGEQEESDFPAFIPQQVLDEASELTEAAEAKETGGILIGHLRRDAARGEIAVEVTAQIPAREAEGELYSLTFDDATWSALRAALDLRRSNEMMLGWWHSHPGSKYWCRPECPPERRAACPNTRNFFSAQDAALQRQVFPAAHSVALVITNTLEGLQYSMFGWRHALVLRRGFHVLNKTRHLNPTNTEPSGGDTHEQPCQ